MIIFENGQRESTLIIGRNVEMYGFIIFRLQYVLGIPVADSSGLDHRKKLNSWYMLIAYCNRKNYEIVHFNISLYDENWFPIIVFWNNY